MFKRNPFGHYDILKTWLIRIFGMISHRRYQGFNELQIEGSENILNLPERNVLFVSNHQTYFADVVAMFHVLTPVYLADKTPSKIWVIYGSQSSIFTL